MIKSKVTPRLQLERKKLINITGKNNENMPVNLQFDFVSSDTSEFEKNILKGFESSKSKIRNGKE